MKKAERIFTRLQWMICQTDFGFSQCHHHKQGSSNSWVIIWKSSDSLMWTNQGVWNNRLIFLNVWEPMEGIVGARWCGGDGAGWWFWGGSSGGMCMAPWAGQAVVCCQGWSLMLCMGKLQARLWVLGRQFWGDGHGLCGQDSLVSGMVTCSILCML